MNVRYTALASVAAAALFAGGALAADLPVRTAAPAPVYVAPMFTWSGFYVGAAIGGVSSDISSRGNYVPFAVVDQVSALAVPSYGYGVNASMTQLTAGGYVGYNFQFGNFVVGLEGDLNARFGDENVSFGLYSMGPYTGGTISSDWDASIRLRLGFLVTPRALIYATGGVAFADYGYKYNLAYNVKPLDGYRPGDLLGGNRTGWTIGAGVEYALDNNWHMKVEYLYADYGSETNRIYDGGKGVSSKITSNTVRVGLSYRFGGASAAPAVARY